MFWKKTQKGEMLPANPRVWEGSVQSLKESDSG